MAGHLTGARPRPSRLELAFQPAANHEDYARVFGITPECVSHVTRIAYPSEVLAMPVITADQELFRWLTPQAESRAAKLPSDGAEIQRQLHAVLVRSFDGRRPTLQWAAARLGLSARSLQRRLQQSGTSFQQVLDGARAEVARQLLSSTVSPTAEVGCLLGFTEESTFRKAFRKWAGISPGGYRRQHAS